MSNETFFQLMFIIILIFYLAFQLYQFGRQHNCPYCHSEEPLMESYDDPNFTVMVSDYSKWLYIKGTGIGGSKDINYCPMCGRGL